MKILLRDVRAGKRKAALADLNSIARKNMEKALDEVKDVAVKSHELVVADWENKPGFAARKYIEADRMAVSVYPTGDEKTKMIWEIVDKGARPHYVPERTPKKASALSFVAGGAYVPKTMARPARTVSGGGRVVGGERVIVKRAKAYTHPGSEGRGFTMQIAEDIKPDFLRVVENAFRATAREAKED